MSQYIKTGMGATPALTGSITGGILGSVTPKPAAATTAKTDWGGTIKSGFDAIASVFGKGQAAAPVTIQESPSYLPWILGGVAVIGGIYLLKRRGGKRK
jgi:hypothetical protein